MTKQHFCKKIINGETCKETKPENFEKGRYSICKECKKKEVYSIQKAKKEKQKLEEVITIDSVIKGEDLKNSILKVPLYNGETIMGNFKDVTESIDNLRIKYNDSINIMNLNITIFQKNQNDLQKKYDDLKNKYDSVLKYCSEMRNYLLENNNKKSEPFIPKGSITD